MLNKSSNQIVQRGYDDGNHLTKMVGVLAKKCTVKRAIEENAEYMENITSHNWLNGGLK